MKSIAVVVPLYKITFLEELLEALSHQGDSKFTVYIGSDNSSASADKLANSFNKNITLSYHRFTSRLGHIDLAGQWNRCVELITNEEWIWVVPDDDVPSPNCIEEIRAATVVADEVGANVIHIPCVTIDRMGESLDERCDWPSVMDSGEFYLGQLKGTNSGMTLANIVYRRSAFDEAGGFISLPKAWGSDHATTLAVAAGGPVVTVPSAWLGFRMSGENISSDNSDGIEKLGARLEFARWLGTRAPKWYGSKISSELMKWFYLKGEFYVLSVWPFSRTMAYKLFELSEICGVDRNPLQKLRIFARVWAGSSAKRKPRQL
jgi:hypothetical protein